MKRNKRSQVYWKMVCFQVQSGRRKDYWHYLDRNQGYKLGKSQLTRSPPEQKTHMKMTFFSSLCITPLASCLFPKKSFTFSCLFVINEIHTTPNIDILTYQLKFSFFFCILRFLFGNLNCALICCMDMMMKEDKLSPSQEIGLLPAVGAAGVTFRECSRVLGFSS